MTEGGERLHKVLAQRGVASRRQAEELIRQGRVQVNGRPVTTLGTRVDPVRDRIAVDGTSVLPRRHPLTVMLHKPVGVITTLSDPQGRPTVQELVRGFNRRLVPVGRLDAMSEGLLLLTTEGDLAYRLTHPRYHVPRQYEVRLDGHPGREALSLLRTGVPLEDGRTQPARVHVLHTFPDSTLLSVTIFEGRNRQIRRMAEAVGHKVLELVRVGLGPLRLSGLKPGEARPLTREERDALYHSLRFTTEKRGPRQ